MGFKTADISPELVSTSPKFSIKKPLFFFFKFHYEEKRTNKKSRKLLGLENHKSYFESESV